MITKALRRPDDDLIAAIVAAVALAVAIELIPVQLVRDILAVPVALLLPGYAMARAIFVRTDLELIPRVMLVPALSLAQLVIGALVLNLVPGGIQRASWLIWLVLVVVAGTLVAGARRPSDQRSGGVLRSQIGLPNVASGAVYVLAAALAVAAMVASRRPETAKNAIGYPRLTLAASDHNHGVTAQALNGYQHSQAFTLALKVDAATVVHKTVSLAAGQSREVHVSLPPSATDRKVRATLSAAGAGAAQRANLTLPPAFG
ncbi:MAG: DUF1616 domain-containing protein [Solirubrobacterales bacterium]|nr:DUF1616 domain-containing protein [Solirubrobacterales bacterium]